MTLQQLSNKLGVHPYDLVGDEELADELMNNQITELEILRMNIDDAIDAWLKANGVSQSTIDNIDYSYLDETLNDMLTQLED